MIQIGLDEVPGAGFSTPQVEEGTTLAQFMSDRGFSNRTVFVDSNPVEKGNWPNVILQDGTSVFVSEAIKGA